LASAELTNKRLIEQFKKTSQELREVIYQLLGFRVDIPNTGQYRLMNMYAESANDYFLFKVSRLIEQRLLVGVPVQAPGLKEYLFMKFIFTSTLVKSCNTNARMEHIKHQKYKNNNVIASKKNTKIRTYKPRQ